MISTYALGSCIAVSGYDSVTEVGGIIQIMLPDSNLLGLGRASTRHVRRHAHAFGVEKLLGAESQAGKPPSVCSRGSLRYQGLGYVQGRRAQYRSLQEGVHLFSKTRHQSRYRQRQQSQPPTVSGDRNGDLKNGPWKHNYWSRMKLVDLLKKTSSLPVTPGVLPKLIRIMRDSNKGSEEIMSAISTEPSIAAGPLKLANSSLQAPPNPMTDLS